MIQINFYPKIRSNLHRPLKFEQQNKFNTNKEETKSRHDAQEKQVSELVEPTPFHIRVILLCEYVHPDQGAVQ